MIELKQFEIHYINSNGADMFAYLDAFDADHAKLLWSEDAADGSEFISAVEVGE